MKQEFKIKPNDVGMIPDGLGEQAFVIVIEMLHCHSFLKDGTVTDCQNIFVMFFKQTAFLCI